MSFVAALHAGPARAELDGVLDPDAVPVTGFYPQIVDRQRVFWLDVERLTLGELANLGERLAARRGLDREQVLRDLISNGYLIPADQASVREIG